MFNMSSYKILRARNVKLLLGLNSMTLMNFHITWDNLMGSLISLAKSQTKVSDSGKSYHEKYRTLCKTEPKRLMRVK